jgi:hypothetical protein
MRTFVCLALVAGVGLSLQGCVSSTTVKSENASLAEKSGAVLGGLFAGVAKVGHAIGSTLTEALNAAEREMMASATKKATVSKANRPVKWRSTSKKTGKTTEGTVVAGEIYTKSEGRVCRDIQQVVKKDGETHKETVTACKTQAGWTSAAL